MATGSAAAVELDFFQMEKETTSTKPTPKKLFHRRTSFRDIQSVISKLNPELLKAVIATGSVDQTSLPSKTSSFSVPSTPKHDGNPFPSLPVYTPAFCCGNSESSTPETAPLTIFYNGTVTVFNVHRHNAENILKLAEGGVSKIFEGGDGRQLLETLHGDLPIARRKSLQRFLEKRKERLTLVSPCGNPREHGISGKNT
ncbi:protein TIFY 9-like isoform X2 [Rhododendron vialii]|uniref:protein TIFY 9-like isoform X2 n=1 Tax=Rhododendron vialii TaxID=182163 RepID=UPI00265F0386|nr:protein TIFY 9-like isoform X2 [Rhododendron vialii]